MKRHITRSYIINDDTSVGWMIYHTNGKWIATYRCRWQGGRNAFRLSRPGTSDESPSAILEELEPDGTADPDLLEMRRGAKWGGWIVRSTGYTVR